MIEEKLEIIVITYNRAKDLDNTFKQFIGSPFSKCKFTILDNCSTDETPDVCMKYSEIFDNLQIVRHEKNIGGNPNILRAVETSSSIYTWIICDDDLYDFTDCEDVLEIIESEKFDLIIITKHFLSDSEKGLKTNTQELLENDSNFIHTLSFIPSAIFRTELFDSNCIHKGYYNVPNLYPHFPFINKAIEENFLIYVSENAVVTPGTQNEAVFSQLSWFIAWMKSCNTINNEKVRKKAIYFFNSFSRGSGTLFWAIAIQKIRKIPVKNDVFTLMNEFIINYSFSKEQIFILFVIPLALCPRFVFKNLVKLRIFFEEKIQKRAVSPKIKKLLNTQDEIKSDFLRS